VKARISDLDADHGPRQAVRGDLTREVFGRPLGAELSGRVKIVLTRVAPGGEFPSHSDPYHHILIFLEGVGEVWLDGEAYSIRPGRMAEIPAGTPHGYRNTGKEEMVLLTMNLPVREAESK
jgi:quercetin dioxygenase-like cupin family protein